MRGTTPHRFAEIAVDAPTGAGQTFSYSVDSGQSLSIGELILVPFGARRVQGIVFELSNESSIPRTRKVIQSYKILLTRNQLILARWISDYYMCSLFESCALMLPPGQHRKINTYFTLNDETSIPNNISKTENEVLNIISQLGPITEKSIAQRLGIQIGTTIKSLLDSSLIKPFYAKTNPKKRNHYQDYLQLKSRSKKRIDDDITSISSRANKQLKIVNTLAKNGAPIFLPKMRKEFGNSAILALIKKNIVEKVSIPAHQNPLIKQQFNKPSEVLLNLAQSRAASLIKDSISTIKPSNQKTFLLEGVTGSGKTEVYIEATLKCLHMGKGVIIIVPEIALTPQTIERFESRFPNKVALLHSGLTDAERFDQWLKINRGDLPIVVGSRSAIFAPVNNLGLIVVDEEHEWTYKQHESRPRYHSRTVAIQLGKITNSTVLLGSASPDIQSYQQALNKRINLIQLPHRVAIDKDNPQKTIQQDLASITVVDMRQELKSGNSNSFSLELKTAIQTSVSKGNQTILFLNRRGSSPYLQCRNCGLTVQCEYCDVALNYHSDIQKLICHYCGTHRNNLYRCPECDYPRLVFQGIGTKMVVDEVKTFCPKVSITRLDRDAVRTIRDYENILGKFKSGKSEVLVGTQMVAKGLHFPKVDLVGVILADLGLMVPDYRAGERTFQILHQVSGRSGRAIPDSRVIIQTYKPDNYAIGAAANQDYLSFYNDEIKRRQDQGNPPFNRLIRLLYSHTDKLKAESEAIRFKNLLLEQRNSRGLTDIELLGPTPGFPEKIRGRYRWQIIIRSVTPKTILSTTNIPKGWIIDVDPVHFG